MKRRLPMIAGLLVMLSTVFTPTLDTIAAPAKINLVSYSSSAAPGFVNPAFQKVWITTDQQVDTGAVSRSWLWGPAVQPASGQFAEFYANSTNNYRLVQYFDKTRMEVNQKYANPSSSSYVSNGLLAVELISGYQQDGDTRFKLKGSADNVPIAGDPLEGNPDAPTYASFKNVASLDQANPLSKAAPKNIGGRVTATIDKAGNIGNNGAFAGTTGTDITYYDSTLGHNIPRALWDYLNQVGPTLKADGTVVNGQTVFNWIYAMGYPITEAYWTKVNVAGQSKDVLVQAFQRRVLTYTPDNPAGFKVEMGNVGQHYFRWRYPNGPQNYVPPRDVPLQAPNISYGINAHLFYINKDQIVNWVNDLGVRWVRQQITWRDIEVNGQPGSYDWTELDKIVNALYLNGIHILISPVGTPDMYKEATSKLPSDPNTFGTFMNALASRYKGKVDAYEIWNEENLAGEVGAPISVQKYVSLLAAGSRGVKTADPYAITILGATSPTGVNDPNNAIDDVKYMQQLYDYNNGEIKRNNYYDVVGVHPGSNCNPPEALYPSNVVADSVCPGWKNDPSFYFRRIEGVRQVMVEKGDSGRQIWLTEFGWSSDSTPAPGYEYSKFVSEQQQADYISRAFQKAQSDYPYMGVMALWQLNFALPEVTSNGEDEKVGWGVLRRDGSKRPSYFAVQALATKAK